jgi:hypothetical protein
VNTVLKDNEQLKKTPTAERFPQKNCTSSGSRATSQHHIKQTKWHIPAPQSTTRIPRRARAGELLVAAEADVAPLPRCG